jgi:hypothetical protein
MAFSLLQYAVVTTDMFALDDGKPVLTEEKNVVTSDMFTLGDCKSVVTEENTEIHKAGSNRGRWIAAKSFDAGRAAGYKPHGTGKVKWPLFLRCQIVGRSWVWSLAEPLPHCAFRGQVVAPHDLSALEFR